MGILVLGDFWRRGSGDYWMDFSRDGEKRGGKRKRAGDRLGKDLVECSTSMLGREADESRPG